MKWISVKDKLPEHGDYVLITSEDTITSQKYHIFITQYHKEHGFCMQPYFEIATDYWMPLPEPPKEESQ